MLQTGEKTQLGGLKLGFTNVGYHVRILDLVTIPDRYPIARQVTITVNIRVILFILCLLLEEPNLLKNFLSINQINK